jgi:two-component system sensor histidine kinase BarA
MSHGGARRTDNADRQFASEMFARLLVELPAHRRAMSRAFAAGEHRRLRDCVHRLLGATAYCDAPELEHALRELRRALLAGTSADIESRLQDTIRLIDLALDSCGYREA